MLPHTYKTILHFATEDAALLACSILSEIDDLTEIAMTVSERWNGWTVEVYDGGTLAHDADTLLESFREVDLSPVSGPAIIAIPDTDWVAQSQQGLPSVHAGRFLVHGSHDRAKAFSRWSIEIDAGQAFGTAHHATTAGCLVMLERLSRVRRYKRILDLGTGSGLLAIAAAKAAPGATVTAFDIDPVAVRVARENIRTNGVASCVSLAVGDGSRPSLAGREFDLVFANILAGPLMVLAPRVHSAVHMGGVVILSGFLTWQAREVTACYMARGFSIVKSINIDGWTAVALQRMR